MKLLEQVRQTARVKHFSYRTEKAYVYWAERYIRFHGIRHPNLMGTAEIEQLPHAAAFVCHAPALPNKVDLPNKSPGCPISHYRAGGEDGGGFIGRSGRDGVKNWLSTQIQGRCNACS